MRARDEGARPCPGCGRLVAAGCAACGAAGSGAWRARDGAWVATSDDGLTAGEFSGDARGWREGRGTRTELDVWTRALAWEGPLVEWPRVRAALGLAGGGSEGARERRFAAWLWGYARGAKLAHARARVWTWDRAVGLRLGERAGAGEGVVTWVEGAREGAEKILGAVYRGQGEGAAGGGGAWVPVAGAREPEGAEGAGLREGALRWVERERAHAWGLYRALG